MSEDHKEFENRMAQVRRSVAKLDSTIKEWDSKFGIIRRLEKRCWDNQTNHLNAEKFAELITKECLTILEHRLDVYEPLNLSEYNRGWVNGRMLAVEQIKEHFGVKE